MRLFILVAIFASLSLSAGTGGAGSSGRSVSAQQNCHPAYQGDCLDPAAPDYNCAGGEGAAPFAYAVTLPDPNNDPYGLDGDDNGFGCESSGARPGGAINVATAAPIKQGPAPAVVPQADVAGASIAPGAPAAPSAGFGPDLTRAGSFSTTSWLLGGLMGAGAAWLVAGGAYAMKRRHRYGPEPAMKPRRARE